MKKVNQFKRIGLFILVFLLLIFSNTYASFHGDYEERTLEGIDYFNQNNELNLLVQQKNLINSFNTDLRGYSITGMEMMAAQVATISNIENNKIDDKQLSFNKLDVSVPADGYYTLNFKTKMSYVAKNDIDYNSEAISILIDIDGNTTEQKQNMNVNIIDYLGSTYENYQYADINWRDNEIMWFTPSEFSDEFSVYLTKGNHEIQYSYKHNFNTESAEYALLDHDNPSTELGWTCLSSEFSLDLVSQTTSDAFQTPTRVANDEFNIYASFIYPINYDSNGIAGVAGNNYIDLEWDELVDELIYKDPIILVYASNDGFFHKNIWQTVQNYGQGQEGNGYSKRYLLDSVWIQGNNIVGHFIDGTTDVIWKNISGIKDVRFEYDAHRIKRSEMMLRYIQKQK